MGSPTLTEGLQRLCASAGLDLASVKPWLVTRMELLAERTETVADGERMVAYAERVMRHCEAIRQSQPFNESERRVVLLGCLFSDIGKTGPVAADASGQTLIVEMFGVEGVRDDSQTVRKFFATYFEADADERTERFSALGLDPEMSIRSFWNLHSTWTLELGEAAALPPEVVAAAAAHHLIDDINPKQIVADDRTYTRPFGANAAFDRAEKLIILLDKYDAVRRRGRQSHAEAIAYLRHRLDHSARFRGDAEFTTLIADMDAALSE